MILPSDILHLFPKKEQQDYLAETISRAITDEKAQAIRLDTARILMDEIGLGDATIASVLLRGSSYDLQQVKSLFGEQTISLLEGLSRVDELYQKQTSTQTENFRKLLLTMAADIRVVLIIIAEHLSQMRAINQQFTGEDMEEAASAGIAGETLYAPLAHRLGLYIIKTEIEDLSLKFTHYKTYKEIAHALNEKKAQRDAYIHAFIAPLKEKLDSLGFSFSIKGRTKSIQSIYKKMQKQQCGVDGIYDLFAIRIILDSEPEKEKAECWQVYSIIADMYQPNPKRLRDWLTIPKSNGYESLHTTVLGPESKWVEVQIRTRRMDEVAEKGVAAHWRYKGIKQENGLDDFLRTVRELLENPNIETSEAIDEFRLNLYDEEVFVFTPTGELCRLKKGSTVLDFAFSIHSNIGCKCVGARVNGKNVPIRYVLRNGDQVEVLTSASQKPNIAWLQLVCTSKAKNKIRQALKETEYKNAAEGKELLERRLKNWHLEYDENKVTRIAHQLGYKVVSDFYQALALEKVDISKCKDLYEQLDKPQEAESTISATAFSLQQEELHSTQQDVLIIDKNLSRVHYRLAHCCNPIYGDMVFGFVSVSKGITIHRQDCPNAIDMRTRYPYRIIPARWSGTPVGEQYPITLQVVGQDDIGIVSNISSIINKEEGVMLRTIAIDSHDGLFDGHLTILVRDIHQLEIVSEKIAQVRGVKKVTRL